MIHLSFKSFSAVTADAFISLFCFLFCFCFYYTYCSLLKWTRLLSWCHFSYALSARREREWCCMYVSMATLVLAWCLQSGLLTKHHALMNYLALLKKKKIIKYSNRLLVNNLKEWGDISLLILMCSRTLTS